MKKGWLAVMVALTLIFSLVCAVASAEGAAAYPDNIRIGLLTLNNGQYYTGSGSPTTTKPTGGTGYIAYKDGTLELNGIALNSQITTNNPSTAFRLTIKLVGNSSISCDNESCLNLHNVDCTLTGTGSLTVTADSADAISVNSLTVDENITLSATSKQRQFAIKAQENIQLNSGTITAQATGWSDGVALYSENGNITIDGAKVTAEGKKMDLRCENGTFSMKSGTLDANCGGGWAVSAKDIQMTGGKAKIDTDPETGCFGLYATNNVDISGVADVKVTSDYSSIVAGGSLTISGGTVSVNSAYYVAIWASGASGTLQISGGKVTATSKNHALYGSTVEIKGGTVKATSTEGDGISSDGTLKVSGGKVTVNSCNNALWGVDVEISGGIVEATSEVIGICSAGTIKVSGGEVTVESGNTALWGTEGVEITGGTVEATSDWYGIYSAGTVTVSNSDVTVESCSDMALYGGTGIEINGSTVQATSTEWDVICSNGKIIIEDSSVTAKALGSNAALCGEQGIEIKSGTVNATAVKGNALESSGGISLSGGSTTAISQEGTAVRCADGTLSVTGGTLAASGKPAITAGKSILNGDVMVCVNDSFAPTNGVKGVLYEYVNIRLDEEGNTVLRGGEGTKYGNPQFEDFESLKPFGAVFRTSLKPPKTGDDSRIALWAAMMALSAAGMITALRARKRTVK